MFRINYEIIRKASEIYLKTKIKPHDGVIGTILFS